MAEDALLVFHYPRCSTCKRALKWLDGHGVAYTPRDIVAQNPTAEELRLWHSGSALPVRRLFNTSGVLYRDMGLKDRLARMSDEECYELLATNGMLVKRPLVVGTGLLLAGFREREWADQLLG